MSKYLGQSFDGFVVYGVEPTGEHGHSRFFLAKKGTTATYLMQLRDNELTRLANGKTTISSLIAGKKFQREHGFNIVRNIVSYTL